MMTRTGFRCQAAGRYKSDCGCGTEVNLQQWQVFLPCTSCHRPVSWLLLAVFDEIREHNIDK